MVTGKKSLGRSPLGSRVVHAARPCPTLLSGRVPEPFLAQFCCQHCCITSRHQLQTSLRNRKVQGMACKHFSEMPQALENGNLHPYLTGLPHKAARWLPRGTGKISMQPLKLLSTSVIKHQSTEVPRTSEQEQTRDQKLAKNSQPMTEKSQTEHPDGSEGAASMRCC